MNIFINGGLIPDTEFDVVEVGGSQTLGGTLELVLINSVQPEIGDELVFLTAGGISAGFNSVLLPANFELVIGVLSTGGNYAAATVVPLPAPFWLMASAFVSLLALRRRAV